MRSWHRPVGLRIRSHLTRSIVVSLFVEIRPTSLHIPQVTRHPIMTRRIRERLARLFDKHRYEPLLPIVYRATPINYLGTNIYAHP